MSRTLIRIREGRPDDEVPLLALFDQAVTWSVARGQARQWGHEPWSRSPRAVARVRGLASKGELWIAEEGDSAVGALVVGHARPCQATNAGAPGQQSTRSKRAPRSSASAQAWATRMEPYPSPAWWGEVRTRVMYSSGSGTGSTYERHGFTRTRTFEVRGWPGQVLEQRLT